MEDSQFQDLRAVFGDRFLAYAMNLEVVDAMDRSAREFGADELVVLNMLAQVRTASREGAFTAEGFTRATRLGIDRYIEPAGMSLANVLRKQAGGDIPHPRSSTDPILAALCEMLIDVYPALLLPSDRSEAPVASVLHNHPARPGMEVAILADQTLAKLYTRENESTGWTGSVYRSTGQGGDARLWGFAGAQILSAHAAARLDNDLPTTDDISEQLKANLSRLRRAIEGKKTTVPMRIGLTGVLLPESVNELDLGWAVLRRPSEHDRQIAQRTGVEGKLQTSTPDGSVITIDYAGDVVMAMDVPYRLRLGEVNLADPWPPELADVQGDVTRDLESLRLGLALAFDEEQPAPVVPSWQLTIDPLESAALPGWNDTRRTPNLLPRKLTEEQANEWVLWAGRVKEHRTPNTGVAVRRMLQAVAERNSPEDVLVDAVIVWENLFGASQETTLRISTALAWLLGKDASDREGLQKKFKSLYALRSGIVHGSARVKVGEIPAASKETVAISLSVLRELFENRPHLLAVASSEARGNALLLNLPSH